MRKTNRNLEIVKFIKTIALIQIPILLFIGLIVFSCMPIDGKSVSKNASIVVESADFYEGVSISRYGTASMKVIISSNSVEYTVVSRSGRFLRGEVLGNISIGDVIDITYIEQQTIFGKYNLIVGLNTKSGMILSSEETLDERQTGIVIMIACCCILELIYLTASFVVFYILFLKKKVRKWKHSRKKKKRQKEEKSKS